MGLRCKRCGSDEHVSEAETAVALERLAAVKRRRGY